ncbi:MAG: xanthine dehydrogenase family protein molybdopterin-binding subunit [Rhodospirillaceae bacterium]|nr:xanthine dehydrogenase family protein molybdopterin-binding subunit [Rhodospirillaceae bacterium]
MAEADKEFKWVGTRTIRPDGVDKVTGHATFGADFTLPGMLIGKILRSPHAHARILSIDTAKAEAVPGVKSVVTSADFPEITKENAIKGESPPNYHDLSKNLMARDKVFYDGHAVAAVAATNRAAAEAAIALIKVEYEVLPHVIDVDEAMKPDAPVLHDDMFTAGVEPKPGNPSNVAKRISFSKGDIDEGFAAADIVVEESFTTKPVHQGYIEPHAVVANSAKDGQATIWCSSQGHFMVRQYCAHLLGRQIADIRVTPAEIGGGFGGKTNVYLEPVALLLSEKAGRPVKMTMSREDVFRGTGPTSGSSMTIKIGAKKDGRIVAASAVLNFQAGAFAGAPIQPGCMCCFAPYDIDNVESVGYDVVTNRPKAVAYRAPGAPISAYAAESTIDMVARKLGMDPLALRELNAAGQGTRTAHGPTFGVVGFKETLEAAKNHPHYKAPLGPNQGRGVASGFWFNVGGESTAAVSINEDGTVTVTSGAPDIGGSRASLVIMAAEILEIDVNKVRAIIADTSSIGFNRHTGGSRVTFALGMMVTEAARDVVQQLRQRAARIWDIDVEAVDWEEGEARPAGANAGEFPPLTLHDLASKTGAGGGPINARSYKNVQAPGPAFGTHICDVEVDPETGKVTILRYTALQDVGRAIHPSYVEGQIQGGVAQGVGWALNEEYIYGEDGRLQNPGFLDYRIPVASDLPMIDTVVIEVPNPTHPFGVRGVGEVPIVPPMAAVANAVEDAIGLRMTDLPMSPPRILDAIDRKG